MTDRLLRGPDRPVVKSVRVPGDKSLSHRALIFAAMAHGDSFVSGLGSGTDVASTVGALRQLGVDIDKGEVRSAGITGWETPHDPIDCGNSGTSMRLLAGVLSTTPVEVVLTGDDSLNQRPMARLAAPLRALRGNFETSDEGTAPLTVGGASEVVGATVEIDIASAQVRTAFELAALSAHGPSVIDSPGGFRNHTERWLSAMGRGEWISDTAFRIDPGPIAPARYDVPADTSSAAYFWAVAAIQEGSDVTTTTVSLNPGRLGFLQILEKMGAQVDAVVTGSIGGDPVGDVRVRGQQLRGIAIDGDLVTSALDELPLVAVVAAYGEGLTTVRDATELRVKESDRIESTVAMIRALEGGIDPTPDGFTVVGTGFLEGGTVESEGDHRIAMAGGVCATRARGPVTIRGAEAAEVSWPEFYDSLEDLWS